MVRSDLRILQVDDDENDIFLVRRAFLLGKLKGKLIPAESGQEAIEYLKGVGRFADRMKHPLPHIVLLDLKMPRMNGFDVLYWIKNNPGFKRLPVIAWSSSSQVADILRAYDMGANCYMVKPVSMDSLIEKCKAFATYWNHSETSPDFN